MSDQNLVAVFRYSFVEDVTLVALTPSSGSIRGGNIVTVMGSGFDPRGTRKCVFDGSRAVATTALSSSQLVCRSPAASTSGISTISIKASSWDTSDSALSFVYLQELVVDGFTPGSGTVSGNTLVTVYGREFKDSASLSCKIGNQVSAAVDFVSSTAIVCRTQPFEVGGNLSLAVSNNRVNYATASSSFMVTTFQLHSVHPSAVPRNAYTLVAIQGSGLDQDEEYVCQFNELSVTATAISASLMSCYTPLGLLGSVRVTMATASGVVSQSVFHLETFSHVQFLRVTPSSGSARGGDIVKVLFAGGPGWRTP
eukprot:2244630-Rhodomonas_salina.1